VAVAIDKDKSSQIALKWAVEHLLQKGQAIFLIHVKLKPPLLSSASLPSSRASRAAGLGGQNPVICRYPDQQTKELFLPFRCFCTRKDISSKDIVLEDTDIAKALTEYACHSSIENLVIGASSKTGFLRRFKITDIPSCVSKGAPDFCNVYVISKGKIQSMRSATRPAPPFSPLRYQLVNQSSMKSDSSESQGLHDMTTKEAEKPQPEPERGSHDETDMIRSPLFRKSMNRRSHGENPLLDSELSLDSSMRPSIDRMHDSFGRPSVDRMHDSSGRSSADRMHSYFDSPDGGRTPSRLSHTLESDYNPTFEWKPLDDSSPRALSSFSEDSDTLSNSSQQMEDVEAEMRRLKLELKQTMAMYSNACKEAISAKRRAVELQRWKLEEERRLEEAHLAEEAALAIAEKEKAKSRAATEAAEAAKRIAELEAQKRISAEMKVLKESEEKKKALDALEHSDIRYRRYTIEEIEAATDFFAISRKIGEGGYGPVYKCYLDHTPVAIKVLRPDASQGRSQFRQEIEVLSCIRHPNMVLLLGACPEYGCLVYEFMSRGSLEDRLFCRGNTPPLSWQIRFKIAAEIGTGLLFLHQTKPEPLVHRDLKPANILLDRNYVSKISDVGLARLVPPSLADNVTQYRMTSTAGTFCYIDPEYQQTGMLGVKSDIYSLGIMFLQMITAKPPMGLTHHVEKAIENGVFAEILDPNVPDWPMEEALSFAKLALKCAELRRKDRPDLGSEVLPELERLREIAEEKMYPTWSDSSLGSSPRNSQVSLQLDGDLPHAQSGESPRTSSITL